MSKRVFFTLDDAEREDFCRVGSRLGDAYLFWRGVAKAKGLDYRSLLCHKGGRHSGLPIGHSHYWCYPDQLAAPKL